MTSAFADRLIEAVRRSGSPLCVGLDPLGDKIPAFFGDAQSDAGAIAKFCEVSVPTDRVIDGIDLSGLLRGGAAPAHRNFYWALPHPDGKEFAYRQDDWKLVVNARLEPIELYDLARDPFEFTNRFASEPARVAELVTAFKKFHASVLADPLRPKNMDQTNY